MWDSIINEYEGPLEDTRFTIHQEYGVENWGWVLTDRDGNPTPDNRWHLWRYCDPHGYAHILEIEDTHDYYLKLVVKRIYLQAKFTERYGFTAWTRRLDEEQEEEASIQRKDEQNLFNAFQEENNWLLKRAAENLERGKVNPTNPEKESIMSYSGQGHRSRVTRPLEDREGGLVIPE
jgi:hypothetical protein